MEKSYYIKKLESMKVRSAWSKGVIKYAIEILENVPEDAFKYMYRNLFRECLLNGAEDWVQYSYGGCALIFDGDIAKRLCNNTDLKRFNFGQKCPKHFASWLMVQAHALGQAESLLLDIFDEAKNERI